MLQTAMPPFIFLTVMSLALLAPSPSPAAAIEVPDGKGADSFLRPHNKARAAAGVPPLAWNQTLVERTANAHLGCHPRPAAGWAIDGVYGQNHFKGRNVAGTVAAAAELAVSAWVDRPEFRGGMFPRPISYSQVVWRATTQVGCVVLPCPKGNQLVICEYYPRWSGEIE